MFRSKASRDPRRHVAIYLLHLQGMLQLPCSLHQKVPERFSGPISYDLTCETTVLLGDGFTAIMWIVWDDKIKKIIYFVWSPPWHLYIFLLANLLAFYLTYLLAFYLAYLLAFYLTYLLAFYLAYLLAFYLAVEVRQCPLGSGARGWGPAVPTAIWSSRLRSGSAHCDLEVAVEVRRCDLQLAVEVRQCPLGSGARGWGPAVPTPIWSSRLRSGSAHWDLELAVEVRQCPLRSGACGWGPAVPTGIWSSRLRSGSAHCDLEVAVEVRRCDLQLAVEVRQCPLGSGARGGGPAVPTGIWTARRRRRVRRRRRQRRRRRRRRRRTALIATLTWQVGKKSLQGGAP